MNLMENTLVYTSALPLIVRYNLTRGANSKVLSALLLCSNEKDIFLFVNNLMEWDEILLLMLAVHMISELFIYKLAALSKGHDNP